MDGENLMEEGEERCGRQNLMGEGAGGWGWGTPDDRGRKKGCG